MPKVIANSRYCTAFILSAVLATALIAAADAPPALSVTVKVLLRTTLSGDADKDVLIAAAEFPPGATTQRHTHPGDEYATVQEGSLELLVDGQTPRRIETGQSYHNPKNVIHETRNTGTVGARVLSTFVLDKKQPIMQLVR